MVEFNIVSVDMSVISDGPDDSSVQSFVADDCAIFLVGVVVGAVVGFVVGVRPSGVRPSIRPFSVRRALLIESFPGKTTMRDGKSV